MKLRRRQLALLAWAPAAAWAQPAPGMHRIDTLSGRNSPKAPDVVARLNKEFNAVMQQPGMREQIERQGVLLRGSTPDELGRFMVQQLDAWGRAFREAGMKPE